MPKTNVYKQLGIPRQFNMHGHTVHVLIISAADWEFEDTVGIYDPREHIIYLRGDQGNTELQQTFCHELVHALLLEMNHKLTHNEVFVDNLGSLLHQALSTFSCHLKPKK